MLLQWLKIIAILFSGTISICNGTSCYLCASPDKEYNSTTRRQIASQTDVFFYPDVVKTASCSENIGLEDATIVEAQICSKNSMCVTLFPNLEDSSFVVRGCFERTIRHVYKKDLMLYEPGCFLLRSTPSFSNNIPVDYIICTCTDSYCNNMSISPIIPKPYKFSGSNILQLSQDPQKGNSLQIVSYSSSSVSISFCILSFLSIIIL